MIYANQLLPSLFPVMTVTSVVRYSIAFSKTDMSLCQGVALGSCIIVDARGSACARMYSILRTKDWGGISLDWDFLKLLVADCGD